MQYVLVIDQGTTGSRAVLYGSDGTQIASAYHEFPQRFPRPGWVEHDPIEIWDSVVACIAEAVSIVPGGSIACIGIANQRETIVAWDSSSGEPLHNAIVWQCRRSAARCAEINQDSYAREKIRGITGLPVDAYFSATKVEWLLNTVPDVLNCAQRGTLRFGTVDSWLLWKLSGGAAYATDYTNAARTMLFDIERLVWSEEMLSLFGVPRSALPVVQPSSGVFGSTVSGFGLPAGIPITGIAGDQQAALFGQACFGRGTAKNTYGTGAFVLMNTGAERPVADRRLITTLGCEPSGAPVYVLEGAIFTAGAVIQWLRDGLGLLGSAEASQQMAQAAPDNGGVYFVPALVGLGAPYWDAAARGAIIGITRGVTRNHIVRAALEAMCYRTKDVIDTMSENTGLVLQDLKVDGGASANDFVCQFQADMLGARIVRPRDVETTARGAAYLAGLGCGYWSGVQQLEGALVVDRIFTPLMGEQRRQQLYNEWLDAVQRVCNQGGGTNQEINV